jgi:hypothetical protein
MTKPTSDGKTTSQRNAELWARVEAAHAKAKAAHEARIKAICDSIRAAQEAQTGTGKDN